jgi:hypothetical protein
VAKLHWNDTVATGPPYPAMKESINDSEGLKVENSESDETTIRARHTLTDAAMELRIRCLGCFSVTAFTREDRETVPMAGGRMWVCCGLWRPDGRARGTLRCERLFRIERSLQCSRRNWRHQRSSHPALSMMPPTEIFCHALDDVSEGPIL